MKRAAFIENGIVVRINIVDVVPADAIDVTNSNVGVGYKYDGTFHAPAEVVAVDNSPSTSTLIDIGPFFDRFDHFTTGTKLGVLASSDLVVQAIVKDVQSRKWVDLARADVGQAIDILISKGITGVNSALKTYILTHPVQPDENLALRKVYFS